MDEKRKEMMTELGNNLIYLLGLKVKKENGRVDTVWGDKTPLGLGLTIKRIVEQHEQGEYKI